MRAAGLSQVHASCLAAECSEGGFKAEQGGKLQAGHGSFSRNCGSGFSADGEGSSLWAGDT